MAAHDGLAEVRVVVLGDKVHGPSELGILFNGLAADPVFLGEPCARWPRNYLLGA
jgi:hypothetical protein